jgi:hypothetical protein
MAVGAAGTSRVLPPTASPGETQQLRAGGANGIDGMIEIGVIGNRWRVRAARL